MEITGCTEAIEFLLYAAGMGFLVFLMCAGYAIKQIGESFRIISDRTDR